MDIRTMTISYSFISTTIFFSSLAIALYRKERYFTLFSCAFGATAIGTLLVVGQGQISPWISVILGNTVVLLHYLMIFSAIRVFYNEKIIWPKHFSIYIVAFIFSFYFGTFVHYSYFFRVGMYSLFILCILIELLIYIKPRMVGNMKAVGNGIQLIVGAHMVVNVLRAIIIIMYSNDSSLYMNSSVASVMLFTSNTINLILWFSILLVLDSIKQLNGIQEMNNQLMDMAQKDMLTRAFNRHYLDQNIRDILAISDRVGEPLSFIILDLDHFKEINDKFGHAAGDRVLIATATIIQNMIRSTDKVIRWGGEEFLILALATDLNGGMGLAEKIRIAISGFEFENVGRVTASFGVAERYYSESADVCFNRVDTALYIAKRSGRNIVICWDEDKPLPIPLISVSWNEQWSSGDATIDNDHRALLDMSNRLIESSCSHKTHAELLDEVDSIVSHIAAHFEREEKRLLELAYSGLEEHILSHKKLASELMRIVECYRNDEAVLDELMAFLIGKVITGHLMTMDSAFFNCTREYGRQR